MATRWGSNMPVDPQGGLTREQIRQANGLGGNVVALLSNESPITVLPVARETPSIEGIKAWLAQHRAMRESAELELQAARTRVAELEALVAELDSVKAP